MNASVTAAPSDTASAQPLHSLRAPALVALALLIALLATFLNAGSASATPARSKTEASYANGLLKLLNRERAAHHLHPVHMNTKLLSSARSHDYAMARSNTMSHQLRGEAALGRRMDRAGYKWTWAGENIGWNSAMTASGVLALEKAMYNEHAPNNGHRLNILNKHFTHAGVDVLLDKTHHKVWLTVDFGRL